MKRKKQRKKSERKEGREERRMINETCINIRESVNGQIGGCVNHTHTRMNKNEGDSLLDKGLFTWYSTCIRPVYVNTAHKFVCKTLCCKFTNNNRSIHFY